jgi:Tfx family DNA-binding protein
MDNEIPPPETHEAKPLLTDKQLSVLRLRARGYSQQEVAEMMGTSRSNISILEKRAHQNIERARITINLWKMIKAPVSVKIPAGTDIFEVPRIVFSSADQKDIRLTVNSLDIIVQLRNKAAQLIRKRAFLSDVHIYVTDNGDILVQKA